MEGSGLTPAPPPDPWGPSDPWGMPRSALHLAEYWPRVGAAVIDFFLRLGILLAFGGVGALLYLVSIEAGQIGLISGAITGYMLSLFVYAPLMMARTDGQTVGHRVTDTRIVMADGSRMSGGRAFVREVLVKNILIEGVGGFTFYVLTIVNYLFPLWDDNNETLHDKMCSTRVVMVGPSPPA